MKKILLLGDSIRLGYDKYVKLAFKDKAEVFFPTENCRDSTYVLRSFYFWKDELKLGEDLDVIHFNTGLWDCLKLIDGKYLNAPEKYKENIERICYHIREWFPNAKVIFATSTPVREELFGECKRFNKDTEAYNAAACEIVKKYGWAVNDLYSVMSNSPLECYSDMTHFYTKEGTKIITNAVVESISKQLDLEPVYLDFDECYNRVDEFLGV